MLFMQEKYFPTQRTRNPVIRFTVDEKGNVVEFSDLNYSIVQKVKM